MAFILLDKARPNNLDVNFTALKLNVKKLFHINGENYKFVKYKVSICLPGYLFKMEFSPRFF